ncbi:hypothetical protein [Cellulosimicrobium funkei]|uniref:hypothetical protein n=1 Tax=Cellulosimicrobium funkei TaxID=264251 RepID=UPI000773AB8D|nr:hypothetical protein [Cellulosimicrobium funkei]
MIGVTCWTVVAWKDDADATTVGWPSAGVARGAWAVGPLVGANEGGPEVPCAGTGANAVVGWASSRPTAAPGTPPGGGGGGGTGAFGDMLGSSRASSADSPGATGRRALLEPPAN